MLKVDAMAKKKPKRTPDIFGPIPLTPEQALFKALNTPPIKDPKRATKSARKKKDRK